MIIKRGAQYEPETRVGHCCGEGCGKFALLYKIAGIFRYRCDACYAREVGRRHALAVDLDTVSQDELEAAATLHDSLLSSRRRL